jgi:hypothetical protein
LAEEDWNENVHRREQGRLRCFKVASPGLINISAVCWVHLTVLATVFLYSYPPLSVLETAHAHGSGELKTARMYSYTVTRRAIVSCPVSGLQSGRRTLNPLSMTDGAGATLMNKLAMYN